MTFRELLESNGDKEILQILKQMTSDIEAKTVQWIEKAIEETKELDKTLYDRADAEAVSRYPDNRRERVYAIPSIIKKIIADEIGENKYTTAKYFIDRGLRGSKIVDFVAKDYDKKREALLKKINKLRGSTKISEIMPITEEANDTLSTMVKLENGDIIDIFTISAGGWNIQKFHFRGQAKLRKVK